MLYTKKRLEKMLFPILDRQAFIIGYLKSEYPDIFDDIMDHLEKRFGMKTPKKEK